MQEFLEVRSWTLLALSLFLATFLTSLFFVEYSSKGALFVIEGNTIARGLNSSLLASLDGRKSFRIFFVQIFPNLSWKLLLNKSVCSCELKNEKVKLLVRLVDEKNLEFLVNDEERFWLNGVENASQSVFLVLITNDVNNFFER